MARKNHRTKVTLLCTAAEYITQFNLTLNKKVEAECYQDPKFKPVLGCLGCKYLETTTYKDKK